MKETVDIGDLVRCKGHGLKLGLVINKKLSNEGLLKSMHVKHMIANYPCVYYVYFSDLGTQGPFHASELDLASNLFQH